MEFLSIQLYVFFSFITELLEPYANSLVLIISICHN